MKSFFGKIIAARAKGDPGYAKRMKAIRRMFLKDQKQRVGVIRQPFGIRDPFHE